MRAYIRRPKLLAAGLPLLALVCAANHLEYYYRHGELRREQISVKMENGPVHRTLSIDESAGLDARFLHFATLAHWAFDRKLPTPCPDEIKALNGKQVQCLGFMYPLQEGEKIKAFSLLRSTQVCCYGPSPQYNQYLLVETPEAVKFERLTPVIVTGKFFAEPKPEDGYIYRMEGSAVRPVQDDEPDIDAAQTAQQAKLPLFDFALMAGLEERKQPTPELLALEGKRVVLEGSVLDRTTDTPPKLKVGRVALAPLAKPVPFAPQPTRTPKALAFQPPAAGGAKTSFFNALLVFPKDASQIPAAWKQKAVFTGVIHIVNSESEWADNGIVTLREAVLGVPGWSTPRIALDAGPFMPLYVEALLLAGLLALTLGKQTKSE